MTREPFIVHCDRCAHEWAAAYLPMELAKVVRILKRATCPACGALGRHIFFGPVPKPTPHGDAEAWLTNGDTGISSETIWYMLTGRGRPPAQRFDVPHDPADFGRCYRLLRVMPAWRARLPEVAAAFPAWSPLVEAWDELTALYEQELPTRTAPKLYRRMQELIGEGR